MTDEKNPMYVPIYSIEERPSWDEYFMLIALATATRSDDLFIKIGAVLVADESKHIIGTGYNNTIRGMDLSVINPEDRDARRPRMKHAEHNCMKNSSHHPFYLPCSTTMYVTEVPCVDCLEEIINFHIKNIVYIESDITITNKNSSPLRNKILDIYENKIQVRTIEISNPFVQMGLELLKSNR